MTNSQTKQQIRRMCIDFIQKRYAGETTTAMKSCQEMNKLWGIYIDWHEFSYALENMVGVENAQYAGVTHGIENYLIR